MGHQIELCDSFVIFVFDLSFDYRKFCSILLLTGKLLGTDIAALARMRDGSTGMAGESLFHDFVAKAASTDAVRVGRGRQPPCCRKGCAGADAASVVSKGLTVQAALSIFR